MTSLTGLENGLGESVKRESNIKKEETDGISFFSPLSKSGLCPTTPPRKCSVPCLHSRLCADGSECYPVCFPCFDLSKGRFMQGVLVDSYPSKKIFGLTKWSLMLEKEERKLETERVDFLFYNIENMPLGVWRGVDAFAKSARVVYPPRIKGITSARFLVRCLVVECDSFSLYPPTSEDKNILECANCPFDPYCETTEEGTGIVSFSFDCSDCVENHERIEK